MEEEEEEEKECLPASPYFPIWVRSMNRGRYTSTILVLLYTIYTSSQLF